MQAKVCESNENPRIFIFEQKAARTFVISTHARMKWVNNYGFSGVRQRHWEVRFAIHHSYCSNREAVVEERSFILHIYKMQIDIHKQPRREATVCILRSRPDKSQ